VAGRRRLPPIPVAAEPDPAHLTHFPDDSALPEEIRDRAILARALAWRREGHDPPAALNVESVPPAPTGRPREPIANLLFISHADFTGNSALHVLAIASELHRRGLSPVIAVPRAAYTVEDVGRPPFPILTYRQVRRGKLRFPDGRGPDLVHAFTPRELVRKLTADVVAAYGCPYVVHLEDNEAALLSSTLGGIDVAVLRSFPGPLLDGIVADSQSHPLWAPQFVDRAAGATVVIDRLLELVPAHLPRAVIRAGFDELVLSPSRPREDTRAKLKLAPTDFAVVYTGNVHAANLGELRSLWDAVAKLRANGKSIVLVKTGWSASEVSSFPPLGYGLRDLGWVQRARIPEILAAGDALVQPGGPGIFNDYRLPSKLPEFLASGRPVVLPRTNVGLLLEDGRQALLLERGGADEITNALDQLTDDPELGKRLGEQGRAFALRELRWTGSVDRVEQLYREIAVAARPPAPAWAITSLDPPVKLVAIVDKTPSPDEVRAARAHGIYGFCLTAWPNQEIPEAPYCVVVPGAEETDAATQLAADPTYLRSNGVPLIFARHPLAESDSRLVSFDSATERLPALESAFEYTEKMRRQLATKPSELPRFRALPLPQTGNWADYVTWLRKVTLQAIVLAPGRDPAMFLIGVPDQDGDNWLEATTVGLATGAQQAYGSRGW
jgi:glycosyltransferase involved in cell wall biosynthesis